MKRNAVAWAALAVSTAALIGSRNFTPPAPAAQEIPAEGQKAAKALSEAFEAVADFTRPSVVQISVKKKGGNIFGGGERGANPFRFRGDPKDLEDFLKRFMDPDDEGLKELRKRLDPDGAAPRRKGARPRVEPEQFDFGLQGTGSGFVWDGKGHIVTNNHVVEGADQIEVTFYDGDTATAKVVGRDPATDVAVIKVETSSYRPLPKGDSEKLRVGEWVMAVGSPFGLSQTVTTGIVSATQRSVGEATGQPIAEYEAFIQTDAAINPGNSGGPLVNMEGRVIGINSAIATASRSSAGVGFAIPIDLADDIIDKLIKDGKVSRVRVGIEMAPLTPKIAREMKLDPKTHGVLVKSVVKGGPADKAGVKQGDVLVGFHGHAINGLSNFKILVSTSDADKPYDLKILRDGKEQTVKITPQPQDQVQFAFEKQAKEREGDKEEEDKAPASPFKPKSSGFGLKLQTLTPELAEEFGYPEGTSGVVVAGVEEGSPAFEEGLEPGDLIVGIGQGDDAKPVKDLKQLREQLDKNKGDELTLSIRDVRHPKNDPQTITLKKGGGEK